MNNKKSTISEQWSYITDLFNSCSKESAASSALVDVVHVAACAYQRGWRR